MASPLHRSTRSPATSPFHVATGFDAKRIGPIVFVWGDNLFKFAPWLGRQLAEAAVNGEVPPELHQPPLGD